MVPEAGVEPARYRYHWILSPARLPIPSFRQLLLRTSVAQGILYHTLVNKSRRSLVYHQFRRNCISSTRSVVYHQAAEKCTLARDEIQPVGLMIYECISRHRRVIHSMIYQVCDLDKKILQKMYPFLQYFLVRIKRLELPRR